MNLTRTRITLTATVTLALAGTNALAAAPEAHAAPGPPITRAAPGVLSQVTTPSRVVAAGNAVRYTWPGVYFEGRFRGSGIGIALADSTNDYVVQVDGTTVATLVTPGTTTHWVDGLSTGDHTVRLAKRTESPWAAGEFAGLVAAPGGAILDKPAPRTRQIMFIGDSWTAGYGNMSTTRDCWNNGGITRNSNADLSFGALAARQLGADYQILAHSGLGMVRNYSGQNPELTFRTHFDQTLQAVWNSTVWHDPETWNPQVIVIGLGINDFSTALAPGEKWATMDSLVADYISAYLDFVAKLRSRYGTSPHIVLTYPNMPGTPFADSIQRIAKTRTAAGDGRVRTLFYDDNALGLDKLGCDWHPSLHDDQIIAGVLTDFVSDLPLNW